MGILALPCLNFSARAQGPRDSIATLEGVTVTALKVPLHHEQVPYKITRISSRALRESPSANNAYLLRDAGNIFVQQSQLGGGSPVLRGFEASRILLVVDGVRMNNAIYRTGHLQNILTIDKNVIDNIEIVHGANSTLYGTDALGGIIAIRTENPFNAVGADKAFRTTLGTQYNSAFNSVNSYAKFNYGNQKLAGLTIVSFNKLGDLVQGGKYKNAETENWKRSQYIERAHGEDIRTQNENPDKQVSSAYNQFDFLQKLSWKARAGATHSLNFQYSTTNDVPRYDRLTDRRNGQLRWAEWYYGPQKRLLGIYKFEKDLNGFFDKLTANLNYQNIEESRFQRPFQNVKRQARIEKLNIYGYTIDLLKDIGPRGKFQAGTDAQLNFLRSIAYYQDIETGQRDHNLDTRYPDGNNRMHYWGAYAQYFHANKKQDLNVHAGLRANYSSLYAQFVNTSLFDLPFHEARQTNLTYSGNIGATYKWNAFQHVTAAVSTAFRVPNIDDLAKVFESAGGVQLVVPNPDLRPEQAINFDLGYRWAADNRFRFELNGFYTLFRDAIVLDKFRSNGQDSVMYGGQMTPVVANQNKARAFIYGLNADMRYKVLPRLTVSGSATYTYGRYHEGSWVPLDHIPPFYGSIACSYDGSAFALKSNVHFSGAKKLNAYNPYGEDNIAYATPQGMPAWYAWNFYVSKTFKERLECIVGIENILDQNYRVFASGISAPGRNFIVKLNFGL